jgi:hypothetical protein
MAKASFTAIAGSTGTATVTVVPNKSGIQWTIGQIGLESIPQNGNASAIVKLNGRYVTSSNVIPASASGVPAVNLEYIDTMTVDFSGLNSGEQAIVNIFYNESLWGTVPNVDVV